MMLERLHTSSFKGVDKFVDKYKDILSLLKKYDVIVLQASSHSHLETK